MEVSPPTGWESTDQDNGPQCSTLVVGVDTLHFNSLVCPSSDPPHFELSELESLMCQNILSGLSHWQIILSPLMEEIWALGELVYSMRVDLIQSSMLVEYMTDFWGKMNYYSGFGGGGVGLTKNLLIKWAGLDGRNLRFVCVYVDDSFSVVLKLINFMVLI